MDRLQIIVQMKFDPVEGGPAVQDVVLEIIAAVKDVTQQHEGLELTIVGYGEEGEIDATTGLRLVSFENNPNHVS